MDQHGTSFEQRNSEIFIRSGGRNAQNGVPAAFAIEAHEDPSLVSGNREVLAPGHAFSVEPGIYVPGRFGMRLEDIVVIDDDGAPDPLNTVDHSLVVVDS